MNHIYKDSVICTKKTCLEVEIAEGSEKLQQTSLMKELLGFEN